MYRIATVFELASVCPPPQGLSGAPKSTDAPVTYGVPSIKKKQVQKPHLTSEGATQFYPEPCLEMKTYNDIISEVNQIGKSMERKPSLYEGKDEEGLRDVFVAMLETRFEGITATGETFNHCGKTDILKC